MRHLLKTCRICLKTSIRGHVALTSNTTDDDSSSYLEIYFYVSGFSPSDQGPQYLCKECTKDLKIAYDLKEKIAENERRFNNFVEIKIESHENPETLEIKPDFVCENDTMKEDILKEFEPIETDIAIEDSENVGTSTPSNEIIIEEKQNENDRIERDSEGKAIIQCSQCSYNCTNRRNFHRHYRRMHITERHKCPECFQKFRLSKQRDAHRRDIHQIDFDEPDKKYRKAQCPYCFRGFNKYDALYGHCEEMHFEEKLSCPDCTQGFFTEHKLKKHRKIVHNYKPNNSETSICCHCGKIMTIFGLDAHIKNVHSNHSIEYICDICKIKVQTKSGLLNHMHQKHLSSNFQCRYCSEIFPNYGMRRTHEVRYHTFAMKFNCTVCDKKFLTGAELRKHLVKHTGERKYRCDICGLQLATQGNWKLHLARHSDLRPFVCEICSASFKTKSALRVHHRVHTERNYECPVCDSKYFSNQQLRHHVEKIHPDYPLPPKGTVMHKKALMKISAISAKYNLDTVTYSMLSRQGSR